VRPASPAQRMLGKPAAEIRVVVVDQGWLGHANFKLLPLWQFSKSDLSSTLLIGLSVAAPFSGVAQLSNAATKLYGTFHSCSSNR
jgi:hypothetical protein